MGYETAKLLAEHNVSQLVVAAHSNEKATETKNRI